MVKEGAYAVMAAYVVENTFPPKTAEDVYRIVVSLNLLNAFVKLPGGKTLTSYSYIKGMAACLFLWVLYHPIADVHIYWDDEEQIAYFRVLSRQFSFHYVPLVRWYGDAMRQAELMEQQWDGKRLQLIALELFCDAIPDVPQIDAATRTSLLRLMVGFGLRKLKQRVKNMTGVKLMTRNQCAKRRRRIADIYYYSRQQETVRNEHVCCCDKWECLHHALTFNLRKGESFELRRKGDSWRMKSVCYMGDNYRAFIDMLVGEKPLVYRKPERLLKVGAHYYIRRHDWAWKRMNYGRFLLVRAHYNNLLLDGKLYNLCVTYGIARYLAFVYPKLRFVNILNYTRFKVHRRIYTYRDIVRVPLHSKSRTLKVWMVIDRENVLRNYDVGSLPMELLHDYAIAEDYNDFFRKEYKNDSVGLIAYSRFHLLQPVYARIDIYGHYARVMDHSNKWAVYSLMQEEFETDFVFDSIWYDSRGYIIWGRKNTTLVKIHELPIQHSMLVCADCSKDSESAVNASPE